MVLSVAQERVDDLTQRLTAAGEVVHRIGTVAAGPRGCTVVGADDVWSARAPWSVTHNA
jgi:phosphoribosylformylglycinamidine cyclo-ligase